MKKMNDVIIIGVDHGYGNIKTANHCFRTGITAYDSEPLFTKDMLVYGGKFYLIGEGHKEFLPDKIKDEDYYALTLVAIAKELSAENLTEATVHIAAGLPLTWTAGQKESFKAYLTKNEKVTFTWQHTEYKIKVAGASIYPQGYAVVSQFATKMDGVNLVADIGNGTMNVLYVINGRPQSERMYTEKFGTHFCTVDIREAFLRKTQREINEHIIDEVLCKGTANIVQSDMKIIKAEVQKYVSEIFHRLRDHGYDENTMMLYITGGGGCLVKNFYKFNADRIQFVDDICAAAKGYEYLAETMMKSGRI